MKALTKKIASGFSVKPGWSGGGGISSIYSRLHECLISERGFIICIALDGAEDEHGSVGKHNSKSQALYKSNGKCNFEISSNKI